ncbi:MAG: DUF4296 domain-containing protein [Bacteroidales bacterium]|nr:DUF4296 domain-containing protein [Bacteroidales bacterium]
MKKAIRNTGLLILLLLFILQSCNKTTKSGIKQSDVIPEKEMVEILCDLYLADGLLNYPPIRSDFSMKDSTENYIDIIHEHGYTKEKVDNSMKYYFIDRPKKYAAIYDKVIEKLSGMEADVIAALSQDASHLRNLWNGERSYSLPDVGVNDPVEFSVRTAGLGEYVIKARIILYADDQSIDPHTQVWFWYDDGTEEGHKIPWEKETLTKNGRPVIITLKKELDDPRVTHIKGKLLNHTDQPGHWEKHAMVTNITITMSEGDTD